MATHTNNYNFTKPDGTDLISIEDINGNFDIIDAQLKNAENMAEAATTVTPSRAIITTTTTWSGSDPYTQTVTVSGVAITADSKVDLQPDSTTIAQLITDGVKALYIQNNNGTLTAVAVGAAPTVALSIQATVSLTGALLASIAVTTNPTVTTYAVGNTFNPAGLVVTATFSDGTTQDVTSYCTLSPASGDKFTTSGQATVSVSYTNKGITKNTAFYLTVVAGVSNIAVTTMPTKVSYTQLDTLDLTDIEITATYTDGTTSDVTSSCTFSPADESTLSTVGTQKVDVSYTEYGITKTTSFDVTVVAPALSNIAVTTQPTTTTYDEGDALDLTGIVVTATYANGATKDITGDCTFSPIDGATLATSGTQTVSISYTENEITKTTSFDVTVNASE